ncbi:MAG: pyridoxamine 5'-phosphate oxidase family protein [Dehalococcoidia bacterium]
MAFPSIEQLQKDLLSFCQLPRFAQMITIDKQGFPTVRTLGGRLQPNWTVDVYTSKRFARLAQVRRNPHMAMVWSQSPETGSSTQAPQLVAAKGRAEILEGEAIRAFAEQRVAAGAREGMTVERYLAQTALIRFHIAEFRVEGFAAEGSELTFEEVTSGLTWRPAGPAVIEPSDPEG